MKSKSLVSYDFFPSNLEKIVGSLGREKLLFALKQMLLIRNFETRAEGAYLQGKVGGFFHSYIGQEAVQTAAVLAMGIEQWWATSYRCHALALLLGATPNELMAELFGRSNGNAKGRGGSMHFFTDQLLGGYGIVGGQIPISTGAAFTIKYEQKNQLKNKSSKRVSVCFFGEGAVAQGSFHESLNLASLWDLPCIYVIENNQWGMGTHVARALCLEPIAKTKAPSFNMESYTLNGMDFFNCYAGFSTAFEKVTDTSRPVLIEVITERFKGHSISDPGLYRSKDELKNNMQKDPISFLLQVMQKEKMITDSEYQMLDKEQKKVVLAALKYADESPWPDLQILEQDVFKESY